MDDFVGQIVMFGGNFAPRGWAMCNGQLLNIQQHMKLFLLLGTNFGGDGRRTFGLPDLRGRAPVHTTPNFRLGQKDGREKHTMTTLDMPNHTHTFSPPCNNASSIPFSATPENYACSPQQEDTYATATADTYMVEGKSRFVGSSKPFNVMQPFSVTNFIICLNGPIPPRN